MSTLEPSTSDQLCDYVVDEYWCHNESTAYDRSESSLALLTEPKVSAVMATQERTRTVRPVATTPAKPTWFDRVSDYLQTQVAVLKDRIRGPFSTLISSPSRIEELTVRSTLLA